MVTAPPPDGIHPTATAGRLGLPSIRTDIEERLKRIRDEITRLDGQREAISQTMRDLEAQIAIWQEAWRLELPDEERRDSQVPFSDTNILKLSLSEAVDRLRRRNLGLTKELVRLHLEAIGYEFKGKNHKVAVHAAWINSLRRKENQNGQGHLLST